MHFAALTAAPPWDVMVTVVGPTLTWTVADAATGEVTLTTPATGLGLLVNQGAVMVQELALSLPVAGAGSAD